VGASFTAKLDAFEGLSREARAAIDNGGARKLFPRLVIEPFLKHQETDHEGSSSH
jgi:hypothetical protein